MKRITETQLLYVDVLSLALDEAVDEKFKPLLQGMQESYRKYLESPAFSETEAGKARLDSMAKQGITVKDLTERESDMRFYEGHSGLRSYIAQSFTKDVNKHLQRLGGKALLELKDRLSSTWFQDGKFSEVPKDLKPVVRRMAVRLRNRPITIYREISGFRDDLKTGDHFQLDEPDSWSSGEKAVMGETTLVATTRHGTYVSAISPYPGEAEVISFNPSGYVVTNAEDRFFGGQRTRRIIYLEAPRGYRSVLDKAHLSPYHDIP
jgi:hypothetical protein